jgi:protocatechuate 3,4-dioxygenase beta subunit
MVKLANEVTRREVIRVGGVVFASGALGVIQAYLNGCGGSGSNSSSSSTSSSSGTTTGTTTGTSSSCVESTNVTRGPYFVDNAADSNIIGDVVDASIAERSDIRSDTKSGSGTQSGLPLTLTITVGSYSSSGTCANISGAQVHIWHCNAQGEYSDVQNLTSENFLRGYQYTDSNGQVAFTTIYPGWYTGRSVHIHIKVRIFNSSGNLTTEATTQLFFADSISTAVYSANATYSRSGTRDTLNSADSIYNEESPALLVSLTGDATSGYAGTVSIGILEGTIYGG